MKWNNADIQKYIKAKEYVDTLLVPLIPFQLSNDSSIEKQAFQSEVLSIFSKEIERELTGRVMLTPDYYYLSTANKENEVNRINTWITDAKKQPFDQILFITFDSTWKKNEQALNGELLWLPGMQTGDLNSKEMHRLIRDQVDQIVELIRSYW